MKKNKFWFYGALLAAVMCLVAFSPKADVLAAEKKTVNHNEPLKVGEFMETVQGYDFKVFSDEKKEIEYDKFILKIDPCIYVSDEFVDTINCIMDLVEETTGLSFYPKKSPLDDFYIPIGKVEVVVRYSKITENGATIQYASDTGIGLLAEDAGIGEISCSYSTIAHELLHVIQIRNYGCLGDVISEGFAESYVEDLEDKLVEKFGVRASYDERSNEISSLANLGANYFDYDEFDLGWLTPENVEDAFFINPPHSGHTTSYWIVTYIRSQYGDKKFTKLMKALDKACRAHAKEPHILVNISSETELKVIQETLSKDFVNKFYNWIKKQDLESSLATLDLTQTDIYEVPLSTFADYENTPLFDFPHQIAYKDSITFDFSRSIALSQWILGVPCKGLGIQVYGTGQCDFYDQYGTLLYTCGSKDHSSYLTAAVPYAVKLVISAPGENSIMLFDNSLAGSFVDVVFDNVTCTNGKTVTFFDPIKPVPAPPKPVKKTVKTAEAFKELLEQAAKHGVDEPPVGGKITIGADITLTDHISIPENTEIVIKKGKKLTLKDISFNLNGTLSGNAGSVVFEGGWIWLNEASTLKLGDITLESKVQKDYYKESREYGCSFSVRQVHKDKLLIEYGLYNNLYITTPDKADLSKLIEVQELREGAKIYQNKKKLSDKTLSKMQLTW